VDDERGSYAFLEINARLQVEHPVSEMVTGVDVVREQLRIAGGGRLSVSQDDVRVRGHAIEARVNAESPARGFMPTPGRLERWAAPVGSDVRVDTACFPGWTVTPHYDSLLAKVIARGENRDEAIRRLLHALAHLRVEGVDTTVGFAQDVLAHPDVVGGRVHTRWIEDEFLPTWSPAEVAA
jgi:acetyl-CoA carboxylase, biotin carboxylase subunit